MNYVTILRAFFFQKSPNGPVVNPITPTERNNDIKDNAPDTWRAGNSVV